MIWKKKQLWGVLIAIALLAWCVKDITIAELEALYYRLDLIYLIPALFFTFLYVIFKALRWRVMISQHKPIKAWRAISLYSAGQVLNIVMPALTGQVGRMFLFAKKEGLKKTFVFSTIVLEVLFDGLSLIVFLMLTSLAFAVPEGYRTPSVVLAVVTILVLIGMFLILYNQTRLEHLGRRLFRSRRPGLYIAIKKFIRSFTQGMETLRSSQHCLLNLLYSLGSWMAHTLVIYFLFKSFGFELVFAAAATVVIVNTLALMIPVTPGNAGTFEFAVSTSLAAFSVGRSDAVLFAVSLHLIDLLPIFALGLFFLRLEKLTIRDIKSQHEDGDILEQVSEDGLLVENEEQA